MPWQLKFTQNSNLRLQNIPHRYHINRRSTENPVYNLNFVAQVCQFRVFSRRRIVWVVLRPRRPSTRPRCPSGRSRVPSSKRTRDTPVLASTSPRIGSWRCCPALKVRRMQCERGFSRRMRSRVSLVGRLWAFSVDLRNFWKIEENWGDC